MSRLVEITKNMSTGEYEVNPDYKLPSPSTVTLYAWFDNDSGNTYYTLSETPQPSVNKAYNGLTRIGGMKYGNEITSCDGTTLVIKDVSGTYIRTSASDIVLY